MLDLSFHNRAGSGYLCKYGAVNVVWIFLIVIPLILLNFLLEYISLNPIGPIMTTQILPFSSPHDSPTKSTVSKSVSRIHQLHNPALKKDTSTRTQHVSIETPTLT